ncbi:hypothetical protein CYMTET_32671 [Cymbomonas tetramitiformis]|uniref:Uncharacterized protein n=1 Tax=Cymbomonas tetramitiformis TaxID=36881 RepID=A0AAE0KRZ4_9CHLO|nr:hypothetical protein CYMTET_32671 [Cymbomonas tetramitiformis]
MGRVIQLYTSWSLPDAVGWIGLAYPEEHCYTASFAMQFVCPHESVELTSREPIRLWKMLQCKGSLCDAECPPDCEDCKWAYAGHCMRITRILHVAFVDTVGGCQ